VTSDAGGLVLVNALFLAAGLGVTGAAGWWRGGPSLLRALGISYLCGVAAYGVVAQLLYVCGASLARWQVVAVCAVLAVGAVRGRGRGSAHEAARDRWRVLALPLAAFLLLIAVDLWYQPLWAYDSWTFWTPKAHALWALGGLDAHWFTQASLTSPDYPILLPSVEAAGFRFTGYETGLLDLQSLLFLVAFLHAVYSLGARRARRVVVWAVLAMLVVAPSVADQLAAAEADIPVAVLFAAAAACGAVWLRERRTPALVVAAVLAAGASATKVEGIAFAAAVFLALAASARRWAPLAAGTAALAAGVAPWRIWLAVHHVANQGSYGRLTHVGYLARHADRVPLAAAYMLAKMADPRAWLLVLPLFLVVLVDACRRRVPRVPTYAVITAVIAFAGLVLAYWSTRLGLHYQLATSARRVVTGILFLCAALTPLLAEGV
jgi:hypothetical protein